MSKAIQNNIFSNITQLGMSETKSSDISNGAFISSFDQARENLVTGARQTIQSGSQHKTSSKKISANNFNELVSSKKIETSLNRSTYCKKCKKD